MNEKLDGQGTFFLYVWPANIYKYIYIYIYIYIIFLMFYKQSDNLNLNIKLHIHRKTRYCNNLKKKLVH